MCVLQVPAAIQSSKENDSPGNGKAAPDPAVFNMEGAIDPSFQNFDGKTIELPGPAS